MSIKRLRRFAAALTIGSVAFSTAAVANDVGVTDDEILIGIFSPISGQLASWGIDPINAAKMAYEDANKAGGIHGRKIRTIVEDDKCNANEANAVAQKLVSVDKVFLLNGGTCTSAAVAIEGFVTRNKVPHVMLNASGDPVMFPPHRYVFGAFGGTQGTTGSAMMKFAIEKLAAKRVAYVTSDDDFGRANYSAAKISAEKAGVTITTVEFVPNNTTDITPTILRIRESQPDVIVSGAYLQPAVLLVQARAAYGMKQPIVQGSQSPIFAQNVGDNSLLFDFYYSDTQTGPADSAEMKDLYERYRGYYPERTSVSTFMPHGYASGVAVVEALKAAGPDLTREKFIDAMETVDVKLPEYAGSIKLGPDRHDAIRTTSIFKFDGTNVERMGTYTWEGPAAE